MQLKWQWWPWRRRSGSAAVRLDHVAALTSMTAGGGMHGNGYGRDGNATFEKDPIQTLP